MRKYKYFINVWLITWMLHCENFQIYLSIIEWAIRKLILSKILQIIKCILRIMTILKKHATKFYTKFVTKIVKFHDIREFEFEFQFNKHIYSFNVVIFDELIEILFVFAIFFKKNLLQRNCSFDIVFQKFFEFVSNILFVWMNIDFCVSQFIRIVLKFEININVNDFDSIRKLNYIIHVVL